MTEDEFQQWNARLERGRQKCKLFHPQMERGLGQYLKAKVDKPKEDDDDVDPRIDYRHVESKKAQLHHRTPDVTLLQIDPADQSIPFGQLLPLRQKFLNHDIGPNGANAKRALHKTLTECLAASGWMILKFGFEQITRPDPLTGQQIPLWSRRFISTFSALKLVLPDDFLDSSDFDSAAFLAYDGIMPVKQARALGWALPPDFTGTTQSDTNVYKHTDTPTAPSEACCEYTEVWYKAWLFDETVFNPDLYRCLILVKGMDEPAWHVDSPYQDLTPQGQLTDDSMIGNPIHVGTLRDLPDSAHVPADLIVVEHLSQELKKFRTSLVRGRRSRRPITVVAERLGQPIIDKFTRNEGPVPVPDEYIVAGGGQSAVGVAATGTEPRDNFTAQDYIERDYEQAVGMSANQSGQFSKQKRTATEIRTVQGSASARAETEQDRIREYFIAGVRKHDALIARTATLQEVQKVLGAQAAQFWEMWKQLPGKYAYNILPDSGRYVDAREHVSHVLDTYNLLRKDERVNPEALLGRVARALNEDPATLIAPPQDKTTEPPNASVAFKGEDTTNEAMGNLLLDFCANAGIKLRPETIAAFAQQHALMKMAGAVGAVGADANGNEHGGSADRTEPINQHQTERTGRVQGSVQ